MEKAHIRRLWRLAERLSINAQLVRYATRPWHLRLAAKRGRRHTVELQFLIDLWSDSYKCTRRRGRPDLRLGHPWWPNKKWYSY